MPRRRSNRLITVKPCGNGRPAGPGGSTLDVEIEPDPLTGSCQWFCFQVRGEAGLTVRILNAGSSSYPAGWKSVVVWRRSGGGAWQLLPAGSEDGIVSFAHEKDGLASYALFPPLPQRRLDRLAERVAARADGAVDDAWPGDAPSTLLSLGDPAPSARQVWIVCGQHGSEHPALWFAEGFVGSLLRRRRLTPGTRFHVVPVANPGGMLKGHLRTNPQGQDPNRHWRPSDAGGCPEVATLLRAMENHGVDLLIDVHTDFEMECVYLDVLDEWMGTPAPLVAKRATIERGLARVSPDVAYGRRYPWRAPPRAELLQGMCAPAVETRFGAAAMTLELPIGRYRDASGEDGVWSPAHSLALGRAAAKVLLSE
ncbi:MAG: succinylglutamate desuccinylase/aspartoacylase family protein [Rhizobiaceae bacterium]|nr:succinylglutamate desuccinylase/aspartoacylase family protein [Rhizobiaceae bacterium]